MFLETGEGEALAVVIDGRWETFPPERNGRDFAAG